MPCAVDDAPATRFRQRVLLCFCFSFSSKSVFSSLPNILFSWRTPTQLHLKILVLLCIFWYVSSLRLSKALDSSLEPCAGRSVCSMIIYVLTHDVPEQSNLFISPSPLHNLDKTILLSPIFFGYCPARTIRQDRSGKLEKQLFQISSGKLISTASSADQSTTCSIRTANSLFSPLSKLSAVSLGLMLIVV